jgi:lipopolysaccharide export LptBFGC system permease protein LptF
MLLFTVIAVAVDSSEKADDFVTAGFSTKEIINKYYLGFVPWIWSLLFPLFVFIAVIFFTSRMATRSEIIAILASGTSYNRFLRPYFIGGFFLAAVLWVGNSYWIPKANTIKANFQSKYIDSKDPSKGRTFSSCARCYYLRIDTNTFIGIRDYDTTTKFARGFFLERVKENKVVYNLRAESISWDTLTKKWKLFRVGEDDPSVAGSKLIVILGHTKCGAVKGACDHVEMGNLTELLSKLQPAVYQERETLSPELRNSKNPVFVENVSSINVRRTVKSIIERSYIIEQMVESGAIGVVGAMYNIDTGVVEFYDDVQYMSGRAESGIQCG